MLACIAFNLTRAAGTLASPALGKAVTATVRPKLINVAARISTDWRPQSKSTGGKPAQRPEIAA
ncbi:hypothetical protein CLE01_08890 [Cryobacterium levicorallinum]|uniref:Transposase DDE domain-containing protein n=1 Tax=Cryobacterium levicorallinum TaxID=995038 RepID=A0ABY1E9F6_9MICO|nr:hypothetical protein CLE01_08890 [Cryobacterium levicorallinum]SFH18786.1 hypothetical protein SAMN05216274_101255 [Cryobacterium levicorallinum]